MADSEPKPATVPDNADARAGIPGSGSVAHPRDAIPLPEHGFTTLDDIPTAGPGEVSAAEVITRAAVLLLSAAGERLGLTPDSEPAIDLTGARPIIAALAGLLDASVDELGDRGAALLAGLRALQDAFREASRYPDEPGSGPGEQYLS